MVVVEAFGVTDIGRKRQANEDALLLDDEFGLYAVADGMGGHNAGDVASKLALDVIQETMRAVELDGTPKAFAAFGGGLSIEASRLLFGVAQANERVHRRSRESESLHGMGSTVSAVHFTDRGLVAVNVGDSPIWLIHDGRIEMLSVLHNVAAEGLIPPGSLGGLDLSGILTRALGPEETVRPDVCEAQCFRGDAIVIGSDGLSNKVPPEEILEIVEREDPESACRLLVDTANSRGGEDNISVIVVRIMDVKQGPHEMGGMIGWIAALLRRLFGAGPSR